MPGIVGMITDGERTEQPTILDRMLACLEQGPRFAQDRVSGPSWGLGQAWFSFLPGTAGPILSESKRWCLAVNGELHNLDAVSSETAQIAQGDEEGRQARRLLHVLERDGVERLSAVRGHFSLALFDLKQRQLILMSDPLGLRPLYYVQRGKKLIFASRMQSLLEDPDVPRRVNRQAVAVLLAYEYVLGDKTLLHDVNLPPPATLLTFQDGSVALKRYWRFEPRPEPIAMDEAVEQMAGTLYQEVNQAMQAPVPVGIPITGGVDCRTVLSAVDAKHYPLQTFTFGFPWSEDLQIARRVARTIGSQHHEIPSAGNFLKQWAAVGVRQNDGMLSCRHYQICQLIPTVISHVGVVLDGMGGMFKPRGGELLFPRLYDGELGWESPTWAQRPGEVFERLLKKYNTGIPLPSVPSLFSANGNSGVEESLRASLKADWLASAEVSDNLKSRFISIRLRERERRFINNGPMNLRSAIEVRVPSLTAPMLELLERFPTSVYWSQDLLRGVYRKLHPDLGRIYCTSNRHVILPTRLQKAMHWRVKPFKRFVQARTKAWRRHPAAFNYKTWFRQELADWVSGLLLEGRVLSHEFIRRDVMTRWVREHLSGARDHTPALGSFLALELWCRQVFGEGN